MAIKTVAQQKARTIEGKPVGDWFNDAAQRQHEGNRYATVGKPKAPKTGAVNYNNGHISLTNRLSAARTAAARSSRASRLGSLIKPKPTDGERAAGYKDAVNKELEKSTPDERKRKEDILLDNERQEREKKAADAPKRASDSYYSKPGNVSIIGMPSGNADVEAAKKRRATDAAAKEARRRDDVAKSQFRTPYMPNKRRPSFS